MKSNLDVDSKATRVARRRTTVRWSALALCSAAAFAVFPACGSSSSAGSKIGVKDGKGVDGGLSGEAGTGTGGSDGVFDDGGGAFLSDSGGREILPDADCGSTIPAPPREVNILLVIDESGSMLDTPPGFPVDKWSALKTALGAALDATKNSIAFGLELFPYPLDPKKPIGLDCGGLNAPGCCEMPSGTGITIPVGPGVTSVPKILAAIGATAPGGGTPTAGALAQALTYFNTGAGAALTGDRYVLLATDGGPNCATQPTCDALHCTKNIDGKCSIVGGGNCCAPNFDPTLCLDDEGTKAQIVKLRGIGVKTFVVGIPGTEAYQNSLDAFAVAGGEENPAAPPKYFSVSATGGAAGLADVLSSITKSLVTSCELPLATEPPNVGLLNVKVDGTLVPQRAGWHLKPGASPTTVVLDGATCEAVKSQGAQSVKIIYGCNPTVR